MSLDILALEELFNIIKFLEDDLQSWKNFKETCHHHNNILSLREVDMKIKYSNKLYPVLDTMTKGYSKVYQTLLTKKLSVAELMHLYTKVSKKTDINYGKEDLFSPGWRAISQFIDEKIKKTTDVCEKRKLVAVFHPILRKIRCKYPNCIFLKHDHYELCEQHKKTHVFL